MGGLDRDTRVWYTPFMVERLMESLTDEEREHLELYGVNSDYLLTEMVREQRAMQESSHDPPPCWECFQMALRLKIWKGDA